MQNTLTTCDGCGDNIPSPQAKLTFTGYSWDICLPCSRNLNYYMTNKKFRIGNDTPATPPVVPVQGA